MAIRPTLEPEPIVRFETAPGEQMQIDFVVFRRAQSPLRAFTASLGFSRMAYAEFVDNERAETWISCLQNALSAFGGTPNIVLCDNPKAIVLIRDAYGPGNTTCTRSFVTSRGTMVFALRSVDRIALRPKVRWSASIVTFASRSIGRRKRWLTPLLRRPDRES